MSEHRSFKRLVAERDARGQSLAEFALMLPMLIVLLLGIADFGRVFQAGIAAESAARDAAEVVAQEYLRSGPGSPPRPLNQEAPQPGDADYNGATYYRALHDLAARTVCREARVLANTTYSPDDPSTPANEESCRSADEATKASMPVIMTCIHDGVDPYCGDVAYGAPVPADCSEFSAPPSPTQENVPLGEESRYVEVRVCYRFTTLVNLTDLRLPLGWGLSLGDIWLQRANVFTIGYYPPPPTPTPPPPPPPPPPEPCGPPIASFTADTTSGPSPLTVQFTDTSTQVDCPIETWSWDFGDGNSSVMQHPSHTFTYSGSDPTTEYTVTLTASTAGGSHQATTTITVGTDTPCQVPTPAFSANPASGTTPLEVAFTDSSTPNDCPIESWSWDFGDGSPAATEPNPTHTFTNATPEAVTYTVTLTVTSAAGSADATAQIEVGPAP